MPPFWNFVQVEREVTGTSSAGQVTGGPQRPATGLSHGRRKGEGLFAHRLRPPNKHTPLFCACHTMISEREALFLREMYSKGAFRERLPFLGKYIHEKHLITYTCGKSTSHKFLSSEASDARSLQPGKNIKRTFRKSITKS